MTTKKSGKEGIVSGISWSYAERLASQFVSLIVSIILARILLPEDYGIVSIVTVFITIGDALVNGGFGNALVHKKDATDTDFNSICWLSLGVSIVIYIGMFFLAPLLSRIYESPILIPIIRVMSIKFLFSAFNSVHIAYIQTKMLFKRYFWSSILGTSCSALVGITMATTGFGVWALIAQYLTNTIVGTTVLFFITEWKLKFQFSWNSVKALWGFGAKVLVSTLIYTFRDNIRTLIIGQRFQKDDLAFYNQGQKYPSLLVSDCVNSIGKVIYPAFVNRREIMADFKNLMRQSVSLSSYVLTPVLVGMFSVSDTFVRVVLTDKWIPCLPFLQIMCIVYVTRSLSTVYQQGLLALGKSNITLIHEIITSVLTIVLLLISVFIFKSVLLIAWSAVIVMIVGLFFYIFSIKKYVRYKFYEMLCDVLPTVIISLIMGAVVLLLGKLTIGLFIKLSLQIFIGAITYLLLSLITKNKNLFYIKDKLVAILKR